MTPDDIAGFYAKRADLDPDAYIELDFDFECAGDPREAAAHLCSEQSTAQWRRVGIDEDFRPRFFIGRGKVVRSVHAQPRGPGIHRAEPLVVHSHVGEMTRFGGIVPEIASRAHLEALLSMLDGVLA